MSKTKSAYFPHLIKQVQNPYYFPVADPRYQLENGVEITCGDLHANVPSFIGMLCFHNVLRLTKSQYNELKDIALLPIDELTKKDLLRFSIILHETSVPKKASLGLIRLLGDDTADRIGCDIFMLIVYEVLTKKGIDFVVMLSNHNFELIGNYLLGINPFQALFIAEDIYMQSLLSLQKIINKDLISREDVNQLIAKYYLPRLKCVDYSVGKDNKLTFYTHAYSYRKILAKLAKAMEIPNHHALITGTTAQRMPILDAIEAFFKQNLNSKLADFIHLDPINEENDSPLVTLLFGRNAQKEDRYPDERYVNGHDFNISNPPENLILLDNDYGKTLNQEFNVYRCLYTHENKKLNFWFFQESLQQIKETMLFKNDKNFAVFIDDLLNENDIYSSWHIDCLHFLLCEEDGIKIWSRDLKDLIPVILNVHVREVIYLLHKMHALTDENIELLIKKPATYDFDLLFSFLLILQEKPEFSTEHNIQLMLTMPLSIENYQELCLLRQHKELVFNSEMLMAFFFEITCAKSLQIIIDKKNKTPLEGDLFKRNVFSYYNIMDTNNTYYLQSDVCQWILLIEKLLSTNINILEIEGFPVFTQLFLPNTIDINNLGIQGSERWYGYLKSSKLLTPLNFFINLHFIDNCFLPDGKIIFNSDKYQQLSTLLNIEYNQENLETELLTAIEQVLNSPKANKNAFFKTEKPIIEEVDILQSTP